MKKYARIVVAAVVIVGVAAIGFVFFWQRQSEQDSVRAALARAFNRPVDFIELNLPPAEGRYPGAVLLNPSPGQILPLRRSVRPARIPENEIDLRAGLAGEAGASLASGVIGNAAATGRVAVEVTLDNLRLFEVDLNEQFKKHLLNDSQVYRAEKRGLRPRVIVRTYEANMAIRVRRSGSLSAEAWTKTRDELLETGGHLVEAGAVEFRSDVAVPVAYETVTVKYVATSLSSGRPDEIELRPARAQGALFAEPAADAFSLEPAAVDVGYVVMGNRRYQNEQFGDLRVVKPSLELMASVLEKTGAKPILPRSSRDILTGADIERALSQIVEKVSEQRPSLLVLYYVGHAVTGKGGQLYLVTKDYEGNIEEDLGEDLLLGLNREQVDGPAAPLSGSNIQDLLDVVTALHAEVPERVNGLFPVSRIAKTLEMAGVPFVILVDACYEHAQMTKLRDALNVTQSGDYYGPSSFGGPEQSRQYSKAIRRFGAAPYLHSSNILIFSATPGTLAVEVADPRPSWDRTRTVGPLAQRIYKRYESVLVQSESISWGDFLQPIVDVKPLGEQRTQGTVSWSDFSSIGEIPMFEKNKK